MFKLLAQYGAQNYPSNVPPTPSAQSFPTQQIPTQGTLPSNGFGMYPPITNSIQNSPQTNAVDQFAQYVQNFQISLLQFIERFVGALIFVVVGFFVAWIIEWAVRWLIETLKINEFLKNIGFEKWLEKGNIALKTEKFVGKLVFWVVWVLFWMPAFDLLNLAAFNTFLYQIIGYLPTAIAGALIFVVSIFIAEFVKRIVIGVLKSSEVSGANIGGEVVYWAIIIFGLAAALSQLGVATAIINILLTGLVGLVALGGGLAFGLGGQEAAKDFIDKIRREIH